MDDVFDALALAARALRGVKEQPLYDANFDGTECKTIAEFAATNRCSELKAAVYAWEHKDGELYNDACRFIKRFRPSESHSHDTTTSVMLTFARASALQLAMVGGDEPDTLHITLGFFGAVSPEDRAKILKAVQFTASEWSSFTAMANGITRFSSDSETGRDAVVLNMDSMSINRLRQTFIEGLVRFGAPRPIEDHGFMPHTTIGWIDQDDDMPISRWSPVRVRISDIAMWMGEEHFTTPLGTPYVPIEEDEEDAIIPAAEVPYGEAFADTVIDTYNKLNAKDVSSASPGIPRKVDRRKKIIERCRGMVSNPITEEKQ